MATTNHYPHGSTGVRLSSSPPNNNIPPPPPPPPPHDRYYHHEDQQQQAEKENADPNNKGTCPQHDVVCMMHCRSLILVQPS